MILSKEHLTNITAAGVSKPEAACMELPEKVLQFGTGVLLRGLPDYFIDKANHQGLFNGRIVVVKSTGNGGTDAFTSQDNLFTHYIRGIDQGVKKEEARINCSISRVLAASEQWKDILACAASRDMQVILSNTTEVGLTHLPGDDLKAAPPKSFPGKLTAFLYERYRVFDGADDAGMVIVPTELIPDNGHVLRDICVKLAQESNFDPAFIEWLTRANDFCNSLVDCIVPGALPEAEAKEVAAAHGYQDDLHITSETYRLWAIETSRGRTREVLSFAAADEGVIVTDNINKFRELKLRLLNGAHTFTCGLAVLSDFGTVKEAMSNEFFEKFINDLMKEEITAAVTSREITKEDAIRFADKVLDRFRNPFIEHQWLSITMQYTSKMGMRCVPAILEYYRRFNNVPRHMAAGFGAYILFMRSELNGQGQYTGNNCGKKYLIQDEKAAVLHTKWKAGTPEIVVHDILSDKTLWQSDLSQLPGFEKAVLDTVRKFLGQSADTIAKETATLAA